MSVIHNKNVFGSSSSSSSEEEDMNVTQRKVIKQKKTFLDDDTEIDESIYQYDEVYEDIKEKEKNNNDLDNGNSKLRTESKSKYVGLLLASKQRREKEKLRRTNERHALEHKRIQESGEIVKSFTTESYSNYLRSSGNNHKISDANESNIKTISPRNSDIPQHHPDDNDNDNNNRNNALRKKIDKLIESKITPLEMESYKQRYIQRCDSRII